MTDFVVFLMWWALGSAAGFAIASFLVFYVKATSSIWPWLNGLGKKKMKTGQEMEDEKWKTDYKKEVENE